MLQLIEILRSATNGIYQVSPKFWINIRRDLHGQSSHFQVLMSFSKRARETASRIPVGTCCKSYGVASGTYFNKRGFSVWKMGKFWRLHILYSYSCQVNVHSDTYIHRWWNIYWCASPNNKGKLVTISNNP